MPAGTVNFVLLALLLVLCHSAPLSLAVEEDAASSFVGDFYGNALPRIPLVKRLPEILNIMGHSSGQITHDVSHYFQSETPDAHARDHFNTTTAFKSLSLEQIMSSDHPPYKRDESLLAAASKAFSQHVEPKGDNHNGFVDSTHALLSAYGRPIKRSNLYGFRQEIRPMSSTDSPCPTKDLPDNVDLPRAGD